MIQLYVLSNQPPTPLPASRLLSLSLASADTLPRAMAAMVDKLVRSLDALSVVHITSEKPATADPFAATSRLM